jgi:hypothetical protein
MDKTEILITSWLDKEYPSSILHHTVGGVETFYDELNKLKVGRAFQRYSNESIQRFYAACPVSNVQT